MKVKITNIKKDKYNIYGKISSESLYVDNDFLDKNDVLQKYGLRKDRNFKVEP